MLAGLLWKKAETLTDNMPKAEQPPHMTAFTKRDIKNLLEDLKLYSGNIMKITGIHGPHTGNGGGIGGVIHTWMDSYKFSADPMFCDEETWCIHLSDPVESLRRGHRHIKFFPSPRFIKIRDCKRGIKSPILFTRHTTVTQT